MAKYTYHLIDTSQPDLKTLARVRHAEAHRIIRQERERPVVAISERALKKAIAAGWW